MHSEKSELPKRGVLEVKFLAIQHELIAAIERELKRLKQPVILLDIIPTHANHSAAPTKSIELFIDEQGQPMAAINYVTKVVSLNDCISGLEMGPLQAFRLLEKLKQIL